MVHLTRKTRNGINYLYLEERAWIDGRSKRLWQKYLGREDKIQELDTTFAPEKLEYQSLEFGCSAALLNVAKKIKFVESVDEVIGKQRSDHLSVGEYLLIACINRCLAPTSKRRLGTWFAKDYLSTVFPLEPKILNSQTYWNQFQRVTPEALEEIETKIVHEVLDRYEIDLSCVLYDPTNFYTFIENHSSEQLPRFGHSKEGRDSLRIVNLSLLCSLQFGIPLFHQTYKGNVQDAAHFKGVLSTIVHRFTQLQRDVKEIVMIFDKGNHSSEAFAVIATNEMPFIASIRNSTQKDLLQVPESEFTSIALPTSRKEVKYYETRRTIYDKLRQVYVLLNPRKQYRMQAHYTGARDKRLQTINEFLRKLNHKKWRSKPEVEAKLQALVGKNPWVKIIEPTVTGSFGHLQATVTVNRTEEASHLNTLGKTILFTSQDAWSPEMVIQAFRNKYLVEDAFKNLKDPLLVAIRPMFHWTDACIRAHVFTCVLGLLLLSLLRKELIDHGIIASFRHILETLAELSLTAIFTSSTGPELYRLNKISPEASAMARHLGLLKMVPK